MQTFEMHARERDTPMRCAPPRLTDGSHNYIEQVEQEIADFHGAETAVGL